MLGILRWHSRLLFRIPFDAAGGLWIRGGVGRGGDVGFCSMVAISSRRSACGGEAPGKLDVALGLRAFGGWARERHVAASPLRHGIAWV